MLSRVANAVHWLGRYIERAENVARFVEVNQHLMLDLPGAGGAQWAPLIATTGDDALFRERYGDTTRANVTHFLTVDLDYPNSIASCLRAARENARGIREVISAEMWEAINRTYLLVNETARRPSISPGDLQAFLNLIKESCQRLLGVTDVTMTHGEAWHFLRLGHLLERADKTSRIVDVKYFLLLPDPTEVGTPFDSLQWGALLRSASAEHMYRIRFGRVTPRAVVDFLLLDRNFPRSARFCVHWAEQSLYAITGGRAGAPRNLVERRLGRLRAELEYAEVEEIIQGGLHEWVDGFQSRLNAIGRAIDASFFGIGVEPPPSEETHPAGVRNGPVFQTGTQANRQGPMNS